VKKRFGALGRNFLRGGGKKKKNSSEKEKEGNQIEIGCPALGKKQVGEKKKRGEERTREISHWSDPPTTIPEKIKGGGGEKRN